MVDTSAVIAHVVSQTKQNIEFLISQGQISPSDGNEILSKLPSTEPLLSLSRQAQQLSLSAPQSLPPLTTPFKITKGKALWGYNEQGLDPNDLSFREGDIIEIVSETNADWWTGRLNGREGLFPSNYIEKLTTPAPTAPVPAPAPPYVERNNSQSTPAFPSAPNYAPVYQPPPSTYPSPSGPPPQNQGMPYNPYMNPPAVNVAPVAPPPEQPPKKGRFGGLGNTLAQSAAGGVGFGAGSAVGSGIINAIF